MSRATFDNLALALACTLTVASCGGPVPQPDAILLADAGAPGDAVASPPDGRTPDGNAPDLAGPPADAALPPQPCPGATVVYGVDVSYYDGTIDWARVKAAGKEFALIRVSDGTTFHDPQFAPNWHGAKAAGVVVGAYQFFRPTEDPIAQADLVLTALAGVGFGTGDIPPIADVEGAYGASNSTVLAHLNTWLQHIQAKTGRLPIIYTSARVWGELGDPTPSPLPYLWVANWDVTCPKLPPTWGRFRLWQYSATGSVPGISDAADLDLFNGPLTELKGL